MPSWFRPFVLVLLLALRALAAGEPQAGAPELAGTWEGAVQFQAGQDEALKVEIGKEGKGAGLRAEVRFEEAGRGGKSKALRREGNAVTWTMEDGGTFTGELSQDGSQIRGTLAYPQGFGTPFRFVLEREAKDAREAEFPFREHYTKQELHIPMRDGVALYTALYLPKDVSRPHPILLERSPYSSAPYGPDAFPPLYGNLKAYAKDGYILAFQDVRGRFQSQGIYQHVRPMAPEVRDPKAIDESTDTYDTIDWLVKHAANNNGRVGLHGLSYPGFYAAAALVRSHPALKAVSPQAPIMDWFIGDDDHRNGALCLDMFEFYAGFFGPETNYPSTQMGRPYDFGTPDGYRFYLEAGPVKNLKALDVRGQSPFMREALAHPNYDAFWQARNLRPHLKDVHPAVLTVGGWYDGEDLFGALECFKSIERQSPATDNHLVMGPWCHGQWIDESGKSLGQGDWGQATAAFFRERIEKPFFDHHLLGAANPDLPKAFVFEGGTNQWRRMDAWPPAQTRTVSFFFDEKGRLAHGKPQGVSGFDEFVSDPAKPVPYTASICTYHTGEYLLEDQRFAATRPDVLVYETEPLKEDLKVAGPLRAELWVSTTGTDSDWVVKVIDVHPGDEPDPLPNPKGYRNGHYQEMVRADVMRGKFRNGFEHPEPFVPGRPTSVAWTLNDVLHTFRKGHRIMVQVQCTWFPLVDRNPQTFTDINAAGAGDFVKATQRVYRGSEHPSRVELPVLPR